MKQSRPRSFQSFIFAVCLLWAVPGAIHAQTAPELAQIQQMTDMLQLMQNFFDIMDSMHEVTGNPERSALLQMHKIEEIYKERGERAKAIAEFRKVLESSSNPAIRNAAYLMLGDALKETGRAEEAVEVLRAGLEENMRNAK